jgi:spore coat polysaccharide biosynthesis predicted glycosyltransferase SpsG
MNLASRVDIFCDGNSKIGYGHIRRSSVLAAELNNAGIETNLYGLSSNARQILPKAKTVESPAKVLVFDTPEELNEKINAAQLRNQTVVTLDWFGEVLPDINIVVFPHAVAKAKRQVFTGFDYILMHQDILTCPKLSASGNAESVLICLGGGDVLGQSAVAAQQLCDLGLNVKLVLGPLAQHHQHHKVAYSVLVNPPNLSQLMVTADWLVVNGGGCLFEALYLQKPVFVLPQSEAENAIANHIDRQGAVLGIGLERLRLFNSDELSRVSAQVTGLVDGQGCNRVTKIIRGVL